MSYLYVIKNGQDDVYKIGIATDTEQRLASLQTGNPKTLSLHLCYEFSNAHPVEMSLHQKFSSYRVNGEWFTLNASQLVEIVNVCVLLGGVAYYPNVTVASEDEVMEQDSVQDAGERVIQYISMIERTQNRTPGQSEIARAVNVSKSTADKWLKDRPL